MSITPAAEINVPHLLKKHGDLFDKHLSPDLDEETAVLKAHLLVEGAIRDFCYGSVRRPNHLRELRLNFPQIVGLARSLMFIDSKGTDRYWSMVNQLNKLRNLMAHELEPDTVKSDKCRSALIQTSGQSTLIDSLSYLCGAIHSLIYASLELHRREHLPEDVRDGPEGYPGR